LDTRAFHASRRLGGTGTAGYDPDMLLALLIYAYCQGVRSSRQIERRCRTDVAFRVLCAQDSPDHATIARFRAEHEEAFATLFSILVSQRVVDVDHRKVTDAEVYERGTNAPPSATLLDRFLVATVAWEAPPHVHFGTMLSSSVLVNSLRHRAELKKRHPSAIGGEMEGAAVYAAAAKNRSDWIVVKGISDFGQDKDEQFEARLAAENAALFVVSTLRTAGLDRPVGGAPGAR
jgi:Transposase domain (DUF772)/Phosphorylase superfamily